LAIHWRNDRGDTNRLPPAPHQRRDFQPGRVDLQQGEDHRGHLLSASDNRPVLAADIKLKRVGAGLVWKPDLPFSSGGRTNRECDIASTADCQAAVDLPVRKHVHNQAGEMYCAAYCCNCRAGVGQAAIDFERVGDLAVFERNGLDFDIALGDSADGALDEQPEVIIAVLPRCDHGAFDNA
jgi:hypothetical protein